MSGDRKGDLAHNLWLLPPSQNTGLLCCQLREQHEKDINTHSKYFPPRQAFAVLNISSEGLEKLTHLRWAALNFPAGWTHWYLAQIPANFPTLQKYPCGLSWCRLVGCDCSALPDRVHNLELEAEMWAYCRIWRKVEGRFYLWWPDTEPAWWQSEAALGRPESGSFDRGWVPVWKEY